MWDFYFDSQQGAAQTHVNILLALLYSTLLLFFLTVWHQLHSFNSFKWHHTGEHISHFTVIIHHHHHRYRWRSVNSSASRPAQIWTILFLICPHLSSGVLTWPLLSSPGLSLTSSLSLSQSQSSLSSPVSWRVTPSTLDCLKVLEVSASTSSEEVDPESFYRCTVSHLEDRLLSIQVLILFIILLHLWQFLVKSSWPDMRIRVHLAEQDSSQSGSSLSCDLWW